MAAVSLTRQTHNKQAQVGASKIDKVFGFGQLTFAPFGPQTPFKRYKDFGITEWKFEIASTMK